MKLTIILLLFTLLISCSSTSPSLFDETIQDLKKDGITFDKEGLLDLFKFFWQIKKDYQSMTLFDLNSDSFRSFALESYRRVQQSKQKLNRFKVAKETK